MTDKIFITGFMGSGKSTIGKKLAQQLKFPFIDSDDVIEHKYNKEIKEIFSDEGEAWFRKTEEFEIEQIIAQPEKAVISLGGGALMSQSTLERVLSNGILVYIKSSPEHIYNRIKHSTRRPLLRNDGQVFSREEYIDKIKNLLKQREKGFLAAHIVYDRDGQEAYECAVKIKFLLKK
jgi:shikimate kinase